MTILAYHFVGATLRDGSPIPPDGEWLEYVGDIRICESGYHASVEPFDALHYAPGNTLCLVECDDVVAQQSDKLVCRRRRIMARFDAADFLWEAARAWALEVAHLWAAPPVVIEYLQTGDESKRDAASSAALAAAWDAAASSVAWYAASAVASSAALAVAWDAASAVAWYAASAVAWDAARDAQRRHFNDAVADKFARMGAL